MRKVLHPLTIHWLHVLMKNISTMTKLQCFRNLEADLHNLALSEVLAIFVRDY